MIADTVRAVAGTRATIRAGAQAAQRQVDEEHDPERARVDKAAVRLLCELVDTDLHGELERVALDLAHAYLSLQDRRTT